MLIVYAEGLSTTQVSSPLLENVPWLEEGNLTLSPNGPRQFITVEDLV